MVSLSPTHNRARSGNPGKEIPAVCGRRIDSAPCKGAFAVRGPVFAPVLGQRGGIGRAGARALRWGAGGRGGAGRWAKKCPTLRVSGRVWARGRPRAEPAGGRKAAPAACGGGLGLENATEDLTANWRVARWCGGAPGAGIAAKKPPRLLRGELIPAVFACCAQTPPFAGVSERRGRSAGRWGAGTLVGVLGDARHPDPFPAASPAPSSTHGGAPLSPSHSGRPRERRRSKHAVDPAERHH